MGELPLYSYPRLDLAVGLMIEYLYTTSRVINSSVESMNGEVSEL